MEVDGGAGMTGPMFLVREGSGGRWKSMEVDGGAGMTGPMFLTVDFGSIYDHCTNPSKNGTVYVDGRAPNSDVRGCYKWPS